MNGNLPKERKNNWKHLCPVHVYKKPSSQKEVHCPTRRRGTWWTLPLILSLCRWLLPPFSSCIWFLIFLGSVHQEACRKLLEKEQRTQWNRGWSYPANTKVLPCLLLSYEDTPHITTTSKPGLLFPWTIEVFLDALIATEVPKPCLPCLIKEVFMLVFSGKYCISAKNGEGCDLFGSSVRAAGNLPSVVPLCNQSYSLPSKVPI